MIIAETEGSKIITENGHLSFAIWDYSNNYNPSETGYLSEDLNVDNSIIGSQPQNEGWVMVKSDEKQIYFNSEGNPDLAKPIKRMHQRLS